MIAKLKKEGENGKYLKQEVLRKLNRRLLSAQRLSTKATGKGSLVSVSHSCCGINSQNIQDSVLSFWARTNSFSENALMSEFRPKGGLVRTWTVRGTVHTFPSRDYYVHVFGSPRDRALLSHDTYARQLGLPPRDKRIELLYQPLLDEIKGEAVTSNFIGEFMSERLFHLGLKGKMKLNQGWSNEPKYGPTWKGITEMSYLGLIVNAGKKGSSSLWMGSSQWLNGNSISPDPEECVVRLIRSYIEMYGPVSFSDIVYWSGHRKKDVLNAIDALKGDLILEYLDNSTEPYYSLNGYQEDGQDPPQAIILPRFDSLLMGHKDKSRFMFHGHRDRVFRSAGIINPTVLLDGFVAGTWEKKKHSNRVDVTVRAFRKLNAQDKRAIEERFADYGDYLKADVSVLFQIAL